MSKIGVVESDRSNELLKGRVRIRGIRGSQADQLSFARAEISQFRDELGFAWDIIDQLRSDLERETGTQCPSSHPEPARDSLHNFENPAPDMRDSDIKLLVHDLASARREVQRLHELQRSTEQTHLELAGNLNKTIAGQKEQLTADAQVIDTLRNLLSNRAQESQRQQLELKNAQYKVAILERDNWVDRLQYQRDSLQLQLKHGQATQADLPRVDHQGSPAEPTPCGGELDLAEIHCLIATTSLDAFPAGAAALPWSPSPSARTPPERRRSGSAPPTGGSGRAGARRSISASDRFSDAHWSPSEETLRMARSLATADTPPSPAASGTPRTPRDHSSVASPLESTP